MYIFIFFLEGKYLIPPRQIKRKERQVRRARKRKGVKAQNGEASNLTWAINALIGNEEKMKTEEIKRKRQGAGLQTSFSG